MDYSNYINNKLCEIKEKSSLKDKTEIIPAFSEVVKDRSFQNNMLKKEYNYLKTNYMNNFIYSFDNDKFLKKILKKIMIKLTKFYIEPIIEKQNVYNMHISNTFERIISNINFYWAENEEFRLKVEELEKESKSKNKLN